MLKKIDDVLRFLRKRRGVFQNIYPLCGRLGRNPIPVTVWYMGVTDLPLLQCVPSNALVSGRQCGASATKTWMRTCWSIVVEI